ncbi:hypothetical protein A2924_04630 [Candidatus Giovannonibacteria bacterium RIFCSPLOWO2_01_FULL_44_16]|uniref:DUF5673 domain-containing protein n=2 Tax=Candidatus Giovannoniibacteriota TaxID=1752738 RepID=A0A1F5X247_9BACT|nr:MAG: hypothetical protein A2924_04630 [Candidatus Giovannonibacteria bacterium RIFCSPLOWO2_01_FULL_44_16]
MNYTIEMEEKNEQTTRDYAMGNVLFSWEAHEYFHHERTTDWYWWVGLVAVLLLGFAVWQRSFLFGILILLGWFTSILYAIRTPRFIRFVLTERGLIIENPESKESGKMYPWNQLESFWVFYKPPVHEELSIKSKKTFMPYIKVPLGDEDPEAVKEIVSKYIPLEEQEESLIDTLAHLAKF